MDFKFNLKSRHSRASSKLSATELMKLELGEQPCFSFDHNPDQQHWNTLAYDILKGSKNAEKRQQKFLHDIQQDIPMIYSPLNYPSFDSIDSYMKSQESQVQNLDQKRKLSNILTQRHKIKKYFKNNQRRSSIPIIDKPNKFDILKVQSSEDNFRRKSSECFLDGIYGIKQKRFIGINMEISMHKKQRLTRLIIEHLNLPKRKNILGKHFSKKNLVRWVLQAKVASRDILESPRIERSSSFEDETPTILKNIDSTRNKKEYRCFSMALNLNQRVEKKALTIVPKVKQKSSKLIKILNEELVDEVEEIETPVQDPTPRNFVLKKTLNQAQRQIYFPKIHQKNMTALSVPFNKKDIDLPYSMISSDKMINSFHNKVQYQSQQNIIIPNSRQESFAGISERYISKQQSTNFIHVYNRQILTKQKNTKDKIRENTFNSCSIMRSPKYRANPII